MPSNIETYWNLRKVAESRWRDSFIVQTEDEAAWGFSINTVEQQGSNSYTQTLELGKARKVVVTDADISWLLNIGDHVLKFLASNREGKYTILVSTDGKAGVFVVDNGTLVLP
jgi:hypothetical protein